MQNLFRPISLNFFAVSAFSDDLHAAGKQSIQKPILVDSLQRRQQQEKQQKEQTTTTITTMKSELKS